MLKVQLPFFKSVPEINTPYFLSVVLTVLSLAEHSVRTTKRIVDSQKAVLKK